MHWNRELYDFLIENAHQLTEEWYDSLKDDETRSIYSTKNEKLIKKLKEFNHDFFLHICKVFIEDECYLYSEFKEWSVKLAKNPYRLNTPLQNVIRAYIISQQILIKYIKKFANMNKDKVSIDEVFLWYDAVIKAFDLSKYTFIEHYHKNTSSMLEAQTQMINEISSPVILLSEKVALLPLIGEIDTARAKIIIENTLSQCAEKTIETLFIDLSGVAIIDTMVAHKLFDLIKALQLIGVETTLSGIRPKIAQTAIQLNLSFDNLNITSSLARALQTYICIQLN